MTKFIRYIDLYPATQEWQRLFSRAEHTDNFKTTSMILRIEKGCPVKGLQNHFSSRYPYLKIELIKNNGDREEVMKGSELLYIGSTSIHIEQDQTVARLELDFLEKTGIRIKVFRRFCNVWIETTLTDDWTLEQQNKEGELLSELNQTAI